MSGIEMAAAGASAGKIVAVSAECLYKKFVNADSAFQHLKTSLEGAEKLLRSIDLSQQDNANRQDRLKTLHRLCYEVEDLIHDIDRERQRQDPGNCHRDQTRHSIKSSPIKNTWKSLGTRKKLIELDDKRGEVEKNQQPKKDDGETKVPLERLNFGFNQLSSMDIEEITVSNIIQELIGGEGSNGVSIVGIRGLGKRAFAKYILNNDRVRQKFPFILKASFSGSSFTEKGLNNLEFLYKTELAPQSDPSEVLKSSSLKWLLWLDDLSDMSLGEWVSFRSSYLENKDVRRKVIFTTLNPEIAMTTETFLHYMNALPDECCQQLIKEALMTSSLSCHSFRSGSIEAVAKKCYGLPLVANHLGLALCKHRENYDHIVYRELWRLQEFKDELLPYLASSFQSLKKESLKCFYYLSLFPESHHFNREELILLWTGVGLVQVQAQAQASSFPKDCECFKDLLNNSILQPLPNTNEDSRYQMNKFTHSFLQFAAPKIYVQWNRSSQADVLNDIDICHLSLTCNIPSKDIWETVKTRKCLRSFLSLFSGNCPGHLNEIPLDLFKKMKKLRVLVLKNTDIDKLPNSISSLKRLCYLDISMTRIKELSKQLCEKLQALQILMFKKHPGIQPLQLPPNFSELKNLVYVDWKESDIRRLQTPCNIGDLINLKTLPLFEVGKKKGHGITELGNLNYLQGSLRITNLEEVSSGQEAEKALIGSKSSLQRLELEWTNSKNESRVKDVLDGLKPHKSIRELQIVNYGYISFPAWLSQSQLGQLEKVHLQKWLNCRHLPSLGQHPALEEVHLEKMPSLTSIDHLFCGTSGNSAAGSFISLKSLVLSDMEALRDWTGLGANDMSRLQVLNIKDCQVLESLPSLAHLTSLVKLKIENCRALPSVPDLPSSLELLIINDCDLLRSWHPSQGQDWPRLVINDEHIHMVSSEISENQPSQQGSSELSEIQPSQQGSSPVARVLRSMLDMFSRMNAASEITESAS